jgi:hypothetical protein
VGVVANLNELVKEALDLVAKQLERQAKEEVEAAISDWSEEWLAHHQPPKPVATHAVIILTSTQGDTNMPGSITVDTTNETATLAFVDDKGDTDAAAPDGVIVTFTSSDETVATVATDATNGLVGDITPVAEGTADIGVTLANADGSPVLEADGTTPFPVPTAVTVTVGAGAAVGDALTLSV